MSKPFAYEIIVNTDNSFMTMGPFISNMTIDNKFLRRKIRRTIIEDKLPHYSVKQISDVRAVFCDGEISTVFDIKPADVWPDDFMFGKASDFAALELANELGCDGCAELHDNSLVLYKTDNTREAFAYFAKHEIDGFNDIIAEVFEQYNSASDALDY